MQLLRLSEQLATVDIGHVTDEQKEIIVDSSRKKKDNEKIALYPKIEAVHVGLTKNKTFYPADKLKGKTELFSGVYSWLIPYRKPILTHHNKNDGEPIGRVHNAKYLTETKAGRDGILVIPEITDQLAIEKVLDGRYFTVSIGGSTDAAICSICAKNIIEDGWCEHEKGKTYGDQECYWIVGNLWFNELSFVNVPADPDAMIVELGVDGVQHLQESETVFSVAKSPKIFSIPRSVLTHEQRLIQDGVQLHTLYDIIATFRKANISEMEIVERWSDIVESAKTNKREVDPVPSFEDLLAQVQAMEADKIAEFLAKDTEDVVELNVKVAMQKQALSEATGTISTLESSVSELTQERDDLQTAKAEADTKVSELEVQIADLTESLNTQKDEADRLLQENADLSGQLHQNLAERVVDMKISLNRVKLDERDEMIKSHVLRKADSLIDTLGDLLAEFSSGTVPQGTPSPGVAINPGLADAEAAKQTTPEGSNSPPELTEADVLKRLFSGNK